MEEQEKYVPPGPNIPRISYGGQEWSEVERWVRGELLDIYKVLAKPDTTWEQTLALRGQASVYEKMLEFKNIAGTFGVRN
jgi:hypothetical protein